MMSTTTATKAAAAAVARSITKSLAKPSRVANQLDWKKHGGSVLSMAIRDKMVHLTVNSHPSKDFDDGIQELPSIPIKSLGNELTDIIAEHSVCGLVVNWPVEEQGWCGAACGRVLHTLDTIASGTEQKLPPICLWDPKHASPPEDEWGRAACYSPPSKHTFSSDTIRVDDVSTVPASVWNDFCRSHWPELYRHEEEAEEAYSSSHDALVDLSWLGSNQDRISLIQALH